MVGDRKTLSILQACQHVGVSRRTIYNWINSGKVEYVRTAGGSVRIFADSLWRKPDSQADGLGAARSVDPAGGLGPRQQALDEPRRAPARTGPRHLRRRAGVRRRVVPPAEQPAGGGAGERRAARGESTGRGRAGPCRSGGGERAGRPRDCPGLAAADGFRPRRNPRLPAAARLLARLAPSAPSSPR